MVQRMLQQIVLRLCKDTQSNFMQVMTVWLGGPMRVTSACGCNSG
jgi:hypothetical protein